jgi:hypothetical protein
VIVASSTSFVSVPVLVKNNRSFFVVTIPVDAAMRSDGAEAAVEVGGDNRAEAGLGFELGICDVARTVIARLCTAMKETWRIFMAGNTKSESKF